MQNIESYNLRNNKKVCDIKNIHIIDGKLVTLYHGTSIGNITKINKSGKLLNGTFLTENKEVAEKYSRMANGKPYVAIFTVFLEDLTYNGYFWITTSDLYLTNGYYCSKKY